MTDPHLRIDQQWSALVRPAARCLELAYMSLARGGLACGSVLTDEAGHIVDEGRNRAYDLPGGVDPLQRGPLAHAEMNALAGLVTGTDAGSLVLWSSHQPCSMCAAAIEFIGVGAVRVIASDPSNPTVRADEAVTDQWVVVATMMFLLGTRGGASRTHPMIESNRGVEPESVGLTVDIAEHDAPADPDVSIVDWLGPRWSDVVVAAATRRIRRAVT